MGNGVHTGESKGTALIIGLLAGLVLGTWATVAFDTLVRDLRRQRLRRVSTPADHNETEIFDDEPLTEDEADAIARGLHAEERGEMTPWRELRRRREAYR